MSKLIHTYNLVNCNLHIYNIHFSYIAPLYKQAVTFGFVMQMDMTVEVHFLSEEPQRHLPIICERPLDDICQMAAQTPAFSIVPSPL